MTTADDAQADPPADPVRDRRLVAVADPDRREVLAQVAEQGPTTVDALAERIADERTHERRARIRLAHCHLPKLADLGAVEYDHGSGRVEPGDGIGAIPGIDGG